MVFYSLSEEFRKKISLSKQIILSRKASTNKEFLEKYLEKSGIKNIENAISKQSVKTLTLDDLFENFFTPQILVVDTEGLDWLLMDSLDLSKYLPEAILFESTFKPLNRVDKIVLQKFRKYGYEITEFKYNIGCSLKK